MKYRNLTISAPIEGSDCHCRYISDGSKRIGETFRTRTDGSQIVLLYDNNSPAKYGLDAQRVSFPHLDAVVAWGLDLPMKRALTAVRELSLVELQNLRAELADAITNRAALADVERVR
jgi:hypothetical protein